MQSDTARQFWIHPPGRGEIVSTPLAGPGDGEVLVRTLFSGISRGTESLVFRGGVPESQYEAMRAPFQEGDFPGPVKYGYCSVGEVAEGPTELRGLTVFCLYPHQDRYVVPADAVTPVPENVPAQRAVLAANMETALNVVWDGEAGPGDRIVVVGAGVVGSLAAYLCSRIPGTRVTLVDVEVRRGSVAETLGVPFSTRVPSDAEADLVIHASGNPDGLASALPAAGVEGTIVEASWFGDRTVPLALGEDFHARRLTIRSSQVGRVPPRRAPRWNYRRRMATALELLRDPVLDVLLTDESDFDDLPHVLASLTEGAPGTLCHRIRYP